MGTIIFPMLLVLNIIKLIHWLFINSALGRRRFVKENLVKRFNLDEGNVEKFAEDYLRRDGIFILQMMSMNVGGIVVEMVIEKLWENRFSKCKSQALQNGTPNKTPKPKLQFLDAILHTLDFRSNMLQGKANWGTQSWSIWNTQNTQKLKYSGTLLQGTQPD